MNKKDATVFRGRRRDVGGDRSRAARPSLLPIILRPNDRCPRCIGECNCACEKRAVLDRDDGWRLGDPASASMCFWPYRPDLEVVGSSRRTVIHLSPCTHHRTQRAPYYCTLDGLPSIFQMHSLSVRIDPTRFAPLVDRSRTYPLHFAMMFC